MSGREHRVDRTHRALAHPARAAMLALLRERGEASPKELAGELGQSLETTSYHMRKLVRAGLAELGRTSHRRGAVVHHYRAKEPETIGVRLSMDPARADAFARKLRALIERVGGGDGAADDDGAADGDGAVDVTVVVHRSSAGSSPRSADT